MKQLFLLTLIFIQALAVCSNAVAGDGTPASSAIPILLFICICGIAALAIWHHKPRAETVMPEPENPFSEQRITQTFISALPNLTRQLNLEIATSCQTEVFEQTDALTLCGIHFGTNLAEIRVPVTYRYHIRLYDTWKLDMNKNSIVVHAPKIRASLPPAIHTDQMQFRTKRGLCRSSPNGLMETLHSELTPMLCRYAEDSHRLSFIRESARLSVAEFVRLWLEREDRWNKKSFVAIHVRFPDESAIPSVPTVSLPLIN